MSDPIKFASVRFYDDKSLKIHIVPISKIEDFDLENYNDHPFFVWRFNPESEEENKIAAQVLEVGATEDELNKEKSKRHLFKKKRYSDVVQMILDRQSSIKEKERNEKPKLPKSSTSKISNVSNKEDEIIKEKLAVLNQQTIDFGAEQKEIDQMLKVQEILNNEVSILKQINDELQLENYVLKQELLSLKEQVSKIQARKQLFTAQNDEPVSPTLLYKEKKRSLSPVVNTDAEFKKLKNEELNLNEFEELEQVSKAGTSQQKILHQKYVTANVTPKSVKNMLQASVKENKNVKKTKKSKTAKKKKTSKKGKKKSKIDNESDDSDCKEFQKLAKHPDMTSWYDETGNVKMFHLLYGVSVTYEAWKEIKSSSNASKFIRNASRAIWTTYVLMNRALDPDSCKENRLPNRSPRKKCSPVKTACLKGIYTTYVTKRFPGREGKGLRRQWKYFLSVYINYLISTELKKISAQEKVRKDNNFSSTSSSSDSSCDNSHDCSESSDDESD